MLKVEQVVEYIRGSDKDALRVLSDEIRHRWREIDRAGAMTFKRGDKVMFTAKGVDRRGHVEKVNQSSVSVMVTESKTLFGKWQPVSAPASGYGVSRAWRVSPSLLKRVEDDGSNRLSAGKGN